MDSSSFIGKRKGLEKVLSGSKNAMIYWKNSIKVYDEYKNCKIKFIPWSQPLGTTSIALQKYSPYEVFMKQVILDLQSNGVLKKLRKKYAITSQECSSPIVKAISSEKIIVCFLWITFGMVVSMMILLYECFIQKVKKKSNQLPKLCMKKSIGINFKDYVQNIIHQNFVSKEEIVSIMRDYLEEISQTKDDNHLMI